MKNDWESPKEEVRGPTRQPEGCLARPPLLAAPRNLLGAWWPLLVPPFAYLTPLGWKPQNKSCFRVSPPPRGGNLQRRKAISGGQFRRGDHLPEGEIVAIIIIIVMGIIEIIVNIIPNISTISISIPSHLTIATCVVIRTIYPFYSIGVDYYFVVNACNIPKFSEFWNVNKLNKKLIVCLVCLNSSGI